MNNLAFQGKIYKHNAMLLFTNKFYMVNCMGDYRLNSKDIELNYEGVISCMVFWDVGGKM